MIFYNNIFVCEKKSIELQYIQKINYSSCSNYETSVGIMRHHKIQMMNTNLMFRSLYLTFKAILKVRNLLLSCITSTLQIIPCLTGVAAHPHIAFIWIDKTTLRTNSTVFIIFIFSIVFFLIYHRVSFLLL